MWETFCIHFVYINSDPQKVYIIKNYVYNLCTKFKQNAYTNNYTQNGFHISTYFDPFVVHFLTNLIIAHN